MNLRQLLQRKSLRWGLAVMAAGLIGTFTYALFAPDDQPVATAGALDLNTYDLSGGGAVAFRGDYIRATWDGDLVAYNIASNGSASTKWKARDRLALQAWNTRKIATHNGTSGVPFQWNSLTGAQQSALGDTSAAGMAILDYLHGDASKELTTTNPNGTYRERYSKIGAVIHSRPYYREHGSDTNGDPIARVYVGANDGMLHSFNANTGDEVFAYVPSMLFSKLKDLSVPSPTTFKYFVDGEIAIADVPKSGGGTSTMLVGGLGGGAKGLFALDISNPTPASASDVAAMAKWEQTSASAGFGNLGNVYATPQIVKLNSGASAVLVPNGANSTSGVSSLLIINVSDGALLGEISAGTGPDNGLGGVAAVDLNRNGTVDVAYAGDLKGTLWKFDLAGSSLPSAATALFTPTAREARPITASPSVIPHPRGGVLVNFGTGKVYESADLTSTATEYIYGIWDGAGATSSVLATPTLTEVSVTVGSLTNRYRHSSASTVNYSAGDKGWRVSLTGGERLLGGETITDSGRYVVTTAIPNSGSTQGAWLLQLDALTGGTPSAPFFDINGDGVVSTTDNSDKITISGSPVAPVGKFLGSGIWSQPVLTKLSSSLDLPLFNVNSNLTLPPTTTTVVTTPSTSTTERGVYGGHFDFDIYHTTCNPVSSSTYRRTCAANVHKHEYDDIYDVVGVNLLNASLADFNLSKAVTSNSTPFKILVANVNWSPAARLEVKTADGRVNIDEAVWNLKTSPEGFLALTAGGTALQFTRAGIQTLIYKLPVNAFSNKEWRTGSGDVRAGLIPTKTGCVRDNTGAQGASATGAWMNGALAIQIVKATTPGSAVEATVPKDAGGYRLKKDNPATVGSAQSNQLAQYTSFWHHPNGLCIADPGWTKTPPPDTEPSTASGTPAAGSADPKGQFLVGASGELISGQLGTTTTIALYNGEEVTVSLQRLDDGSVKQTLTNKGGKVVSEVISTWGKTESGGTQKSDRARTGRLGWRELVR